MRPVIVVVFTVFRAQDLRLQFGGKFHPTQERVLELAVERLAVGVLTRTPGGDVERRDPLTNPATT